MKFIYPYRTLTGFIALAIDEASIDGREMAAGYFDTARQEVSLAPLDDSPWSSVTMHVTATAPAVEINAPDSPWSDPALSIMIQSGSSNARLAVTMEADPDTDGVWHASIRLERASFAGVATMTAIATATVDGVPFRRIGASDPWTLRFEDKPRSQAYDALSMAWVDFANPTDGEPDLRAFSKEPIYLVIEENGPILYLNKGFDGLYPVLSDARRRSGAVRSVYNLTRSDIASRVWQALFLASLAHAEIDEDTGEISWPVPEWMVTVLQLLLPRLYPGRGVNDALVEALAAMSSPDAAAGLHADLVRAASAQAQMPKLMRMGFDLLSDLPTVEGDPA